VIAKSVTPLEANVALIWDDWCLKRLVLREREEKKRNLHNSVCVVINENISLRMNVMVFGSREENLVQRNV
jgi:hypothetical protein